MLDLLVIAAGFAAGLLAIVGVNAVRRGSATIPNAPAPAAPRGPAPAPSPPSGHGGPPPRSYGASAAPPPPAGPTAYAGAADHGIRVNLPGAAAPAPAPAAPIAPVPVPPAPAPPPEVDVPDEATAIAAGPSLAKAAPADAATGPRLELEDGSDGVDLGDEPVTLGRGSDQVLRVRDTKASRAHAVVRRRSKGRPGWEVADQGSANGTYLNDHRIPDGRVAPLRAGDRIGIGDTVVRYVEPDASETDSSPPTPPPPAPLPDPDATQVQR